jgi:hypothetical protein
MIVVVFTAGSASKTQMTNDILGMISPEGEKVSLGKVSSY